jgi:hypothetical protein
VSLLCWNWSQEQVSKPMRNSLHVRDCADELRTPGRGLVAATEL